MPVPRNRSDPWSATMLNPERGAEAWRSAPKHATNRPKRTLERHRKQRLEAPQAFVQSQRWSCSWDRGRAAHARLPRRTPLPATCLRRYVGSVAVPKAYGSTASFHGKCTEVRLSPDRRHPVALRQSMPCATTDSCGAAYNPCATEARQDHPD